ncbi:hypothetical protein INO08_16070, partial [Staphylococcus aureus]|nr:hypothetical protein [Staphylococcus aureus]
GLLKVFLRMSIRDAMLMEKCDVSTPEALEEAVNTYTPSHPLVVKRTAQLEREFAYYKQGKSPFISESAKLNAKVLDGYEWWELY